MHAKTREDNVTLRLLRDNKLKQPDEVRQVIPILILVICTMVFLWMIYKLLLQELARILITRCCPGVQRHLHNLKVAIGILPRDQIRQDGQSEDSSSDDLDSDNDQELNDVLEGLVERRSP